jgi:hypothetical protein
MGGCLDPWRLSMPRRVELADALEWLCDHPDVGPIVTSPPDMSETGQRPAAWRLWFQRAVWSCLSAVGEEAPAVFYVTDRRYDGELLSKAGIVLELARRTGRRVMWHKIALRLSPGTEDSRRPGYVHLIAVGGAGVTPGFRTASAAWPDVFPMGPRLYKNGMGLDAARVAVAYCARFGSTIVNPFCGHGTVLLAAEEQGLGAVGIDSDPDMVERARIAALPAPRGGQPAYSRPTEEERDSV